MLSSMNLIPHERCTADFIINRAVVAVLLTRTIYTYRIRQTKGPFNQFKEPECLGTFPEPSLI